MSRREVEYIMICPFHSRKLSCPSQIASVFFLLFPRPQSLCRPQQGVSPEGMFTFCSMLQLVRVSLLCKFLKRQCSSIQSSLASYGILPSKLFAAVSPQSYQGYAFPSTILCRISLLILSDTLSLLSPVPVSYTHL